MERDSSPSPLPVVLPRGRHRTGMLAAVVSLAAPLVLLAAAPAQADVEAFSFTSMEADYYLTQDEDGLARLTVVERLVADFPDADQNRGIVRDLVTHDGGKSLDTTLISVVDENGEEVRVEDGDGDGLSLALDDDEFKHGEHSYVITYTMSDVVRAFSDGDEFFPDVNGVVWQQPFGSVTGRLHLDETLSGALDGRTECFTGDSGSSESACTVTTEPGEGDWPDAAPRPVGETIVITATAADLEPEENLSFVVGFAPGTFLETPAPATFWIGLGGLILAAFAALFQLFGGLFRRLRQRRRLPQPRIVQYALPEGVTVRDAAVVLGKKSLLVTAHTIDLAVRDLIEVVTDETDARTAKAEDYELVLTDGASLPTAGKEDDKDLLRALFGKKAEQGSRVDLGSQSNRRAKRIAKYLKLTTVLGESRGWISSATAGNPVTAIAITLGVLGAGAAFVGVVSEAFPPVPFLLALAGIVVVGIIGLIVTPAWVPLAEQGFALKQHLLGMRDYLRLAEEERLAYLQAPSTAERRTPGAQPSVSRPADWAGEGDLVVHVYERLLPVAVLFGMQKEWASVLSQLAEARPEVAGSAHPIVYYAVYSGQLTSGIGAAASPWSGGGASGGSGFSSGGGFSGGGFGGGGGGGR